MQLIEIVKKALEEDERYRDDDINLYFRVLSDHGFSKDTTIYELLSAQKAGRVPSEETVRRTRRQLQEHNPSLRGKTYVLRQRRGTKHREMYRESKGRT